jgi:hypothetical protein
MRNNNTQMMYVIFFSIFLGGCGGGGSSSGVEAEVAKVEVPEAEVAEADVPEAEVPEAEVAEAEVPEAEVPEAEVSETPSYETHSTNVSGVWSGTTTMFGAAVVVNVTVHQAVSDSAESPAQALTGTATLNGGAPFNVIGTKEGDAWSVSGGSGDVILSTE